MAQMQGDPKAQETTYSSFGTYDGWSNSTLNLKTGL